MRIIVVRRVGLARSRVRAPPGRSPAHGAARERTFVRPVVGAGRRAPARRSAPRRREGDRGRSSSARSAGRRASSPGRARSRAAGQAVREAQASSRPLLLRSRIAAVPRDRKSTRLNSSHTVISYAVFCLKKKKKNNQNHLIHKKNTIKKKT